MLPRCTLAALALGIVVALSAGTAAAPSAQAVEAGLNCATYEDGVCEVTIGDLWFCSAAFSNGVCPNSVVEGETVHWQYPVSGGLAHTATHCGADCDAPSPPLWDSGRLNPGDSFSFAFEEPGMYAYFCRIHPFTMRGLIRVLEQEAPPAPIGDVNCDGQVNAIDATLVLQLSGGLVRSLACQQNADTNANGTVNAIDATLILQFIAGLIPRLPPR